MAKIEDIYPLMPMQEGMLFHSLYTPQSGVYVEQLACTITGPLKVEAFAAGWRQVVNRHAALRSSFEWEGLERPVQVVHAAVEVQLERQDWRDASRKEQESKLEEYLEREQKQGFAVDRAPLMRLCLLRTGEQEYQFVWSHHHLLMDGWSLPLVLKEVFDCYQAGGQQLELPRPARYKDYVQWRKRQDLKKAEQYWRQTLKGFQSPTLLRVEKAENDEQGPYSPGHMETDLSDEMTAALQRWARQHQLTLNTVMLGAWALLLSHYSGEKDVVFGATVSGRSADVPGLEKMVGLFINTLPVRASTSSDMLLLPWLKALQGEQVRARQFEHSPLVEVQRWSEVPGGVPLFGSIVVFENYPIDGALQDQARLAGLEIGWVRRAEQTNYPLTLMAAPGRQMKLHIGFDRKCYEFESIQRMLEHLGNLIEGIVSNADVRLGDLSLLGKEERQRILVEYNRTEVVYPTKKLVHELFEEQAGRTPDAVAVEFEEQRLSYAELDRKANRLAHRLMVMGAGPDVLVATCMRRSPEMIIGLLATLKAGSAYVPLDPDYPADRLAFMFEDAHPAVLLTQQELLAKLPSHLGHTICLDRQTDWNEISKCSEGTPGAPVHSQSLAYVIYTSGSTGAPKGAMNTHAGLRNHLLWRQAHLVLTPADRILQKISISFDPSVWEIWGPLLAGARLVLASGPTDDPHYIVHAIANHGITVFQSPPPVLQTLLNEPGFVGCSSLRDVMCGAEALPPQLEERFFAHSNANLHNLYGPTETAVDVTCWKCVRGSQKKVVPIGAPVANTLVYVVDKDMAPVPVGVPGALYVGGVGVARGYLGRPDLTAERFIPDPFSAAPGERLYQTGDMARWQADGTIEFLGRMDHQVKVRGFRIELGEIEAVLEQHEAVVQAIVLAREDRPGDKRLVAYIVGEKDGSAYDSRELRSFASNKLPGYMVPSAFVKLQTLPLTTNGKVDRRALLAPELCGREQRYIAPRTPVEEMVAGIWMEVLGAPRVGVDDDFFELGGHSLLATQVVSRIRKLWTLELPLKSVFEEGTVAGLARVIEELRQKKLGTGLPSIQPVSAPGPHPLSFAQERLWFLEQLEPGKSTYHMTARVKLVGALDVGALAKSFNEVVRRHESLRTVFKVNQGRAVQFIQPYLEISLPTVDLEGPGTSQREEQVRDLLQQESESCFDLESGPLLRVLLLRLGAQEHVMQLTMHHIISDGWSMRVLLGEIAALYRSYVLGDESSLTELKIQYPAYATWQREYLEGGVEKQLEYWRKQMLGLEALELPTDYPRPKVLGHDGRTARRTVNLSSDLKKLARQENVTLFMLLLASFQVLLARYTNQTDIAVGTPIANRNREEIEGMIGFFVNTLVLRADLNANPMFRDVLRQVRRLALDAYAHQELPLEKLVDDLQPQRDFGQTPLFQVMFLLQDPPLPEMEIDGLRLIPIAAGQQSAKFDLTLEIAQDEAKLLLEMHYRPELFKAATVQRMLGHYETLLHAIAVNVKQRIGDLPLLRDDEKFQLLLEWNHPQAGPSGKCIHELFESQVNSTPNVVAVECGQYRLSYAELNERSNQLAWHLRKRGVGPDTRVGFCIERGPDMVVALLAILKAGGAYVPMDPAFPVDRLAFMLEDSGAKLVVTQQQLLPRLPVNWLADQVFCMDSDWRSIEQQSRENLPSLTSVEDLAYVIYTSGSTGQPKGSEVPHRSITGFIFGIDYVTFDTQSALFQHSSVSWDALTLELWPALLRGGRCVLYSGQVINPADLQEHIQRFGVNTLWLTAALFNSIIEVSPESLQGVQQLMIGGEALSVAHIRKAWERLPGVRIVNGYGPSECTVFSNCYHIREQMREDTRSVPIGKPIGDRRVHLLDGWMNLVPIGVAGEIYIGGPSVARGYLRRPAMTAEKFVPDPFSAQHGARLYKTGDLARWLPDGNLEFVGRTDHQVKVRGFRIELREIEAVLQQHQSARQAIVVAREDRPGDKRLVAYVVRNTEDRRTDYAAELRSYLKGLLPEYMVPAAFVAIDAIPLNNNGKVDHRRLPAPELEDTGSDREHVGPETQAEKILAEIWAAVLGTKRVGIHDNFFEVGGDSILSIQIVARANQAGLPITARQMFEEQTIAGLARVAASGKFNEMQAEQGAVTGDVPLTPIQTWFFEQSFVNWNHFNQAALVRLKTEISRDLVVKVVTELLHRHDALRMRYHKERGEWRQENLRAEDADSVVQYVDLRHVTDRTESEAIEYEAEKWQRSLDLEHGPLLRVVLMDLRGSQRLLVIVHHLVIDGVSWRVLLHDFERAYRQLAAEGIAQLGSKTASFKQWAQMLQEYGRSEAVRDEYSYWEKVLQPGQVRIPRDNEDQEKGAGAMEAVSVSADRDVTDALLHELPAVQHTYINDTLLAVLGRVLSQWFEAESILVDVEGHGREEALIGANVSGTVGWFTSLYPVRLEYKEGEGWSEALKRTRENLRGVPNQGIGFGLLRYLGEQKVINMLRGLPRPLVCFNYLGQQDQLFSDDALFAVAEEPVGTVIAPATERTYLLIVNAEVSQGRLRVNWSYETSQYRRQTIEDLARSFVETLNSLVDDCRLRPISNYSPSDFPLAALDQGDLDDLVSALK
jgi:amino acid adenylation domain-containing protein/non-ribosomal peptide synthase protein (TIGR01720 family)